MRAHHEIDVLGLEPDRGKIGEVWRVDHVKRINAAALFVVAAAGIE
jgi:hypothetical protein